MPRHVREESATCWDCGRPPAEQHSVHSEGCDRDEECYCDDDEEGCLACRERQKWIILAAKLRNDVTRLEMAGKMMEFLVRYSGKVAP